jgi:hypothetical protein
VKRLGSMPRLSAIFWVRMSGSARTSWWRASPRIEIPYADCAGTPGSRAQELKVGERRLCEKSRLEWEMRTYLYSSDVRCSVFGDHVFGKSGPSTVRAPVLAGGDGCSGSISVFWGVIAFLSQRSGQVQCRQSPWMLVVGFQKRGKGTRRAPGRTKRDEKERGRECVEARP